MGYIYLITCVNTEKVYVGSTLRTKRRKHMHFHLLRHGRHHAPHLQNSFNKHGESAFSFDVVEVVEDNNFLLAREQFWMWRFEGRLYNASLCAHSRLGMRASSESIAKLSSVMAGNKLRLGVPNSEEARRKIGLGNLRAIAEGRKTPWGASVTPMNGERNPKSKLTVKDVLFIRSSQLSKKELAIRFGVSRQNVSLIQNRKSWAWVGDSE
jgi:group I intron endonuclease